MKKIRIKELARQLEIPSHEILEMLPELGVTEKKTHSSSIDDDVADKIRHRFGGNGVAVAEAPSDQEVHTVPVDGSRTAAEPSYEEAAVEEAPPPPLQAVGMVEESVAVPVAPSLASPGPS